MIQLTPELSGSNQEDEAVALPNPEIIREQIKHVLQPLLQETVEVELPRPRKVQQDSKTSLSWDEARRKGHARMLNGGH